MISKTDSTPLIYSSWYIRVKVYTSEAGLNGLDGFNRRAGRADWQVRRHLDNAARQRCVTVLTLRLAGKWAFCNGGFSASLLASAGAPILLETPVPGH